jgi:hypothetical protein
MDEKDDDLGALRSVRAPTENLIILAAIALVIGSAGSRPE